MTARFLPLPAIPAEATPVLIALAPGSFEGTPFLAAEADPGGTFPLFLACLAWWPPEGAGRVGAVLGPQRVLSRRLGRQAG